MEAAGQCPSGRAVYGCQGERGGSGSVCEVSHGGGTGGGGAGGDRGHREALRPGQEQGPDISACMRMLRDEYDGKVPDDFDQLLKLPGVGRKSANLIMGDVFGKPAIVTDTHCIRLCNRIGSGGSDQRSEEGGDGALEDHPAGGGQRLLPPAGLSWPGDLHGADQAILRPVLPGGYLRQSRRRGMRPADGGEI